MSVLYFCYVGIFAHFIADFIITMWFTI